MGRAHPQYFATIAEDFGDTLLGGVRACLKIGKCASHVQRPMEAASRERVRRLFEKRKPASVRTSGLIQELALQISTLSIG